MIWALVAALCIVPLGVFLVRPRVATLFNKDFQGIKTEAIVGPMVTLAVFLSALLVAQATASYQRASQGASAEASAVDLLYENSGILPDGQGQAMQQASVCYARAVKHLEWPAMADLHTAPEVDHWAQRFNELIPGLLSGPGPVVGQIVGLNRAQSEARMSRLNEAAPNLPVLTIALMIGAVLIVLLAVSSLAIADMRRGVVLTMGLVLALLLGGVLLLVEQLEQPFSGVIRIEPKVITRVEKEMSTNFASVHPGVALPCDASGHPTPAN